MKKVEGRPNGGGELARAAERIGRTTQSAKVFRTLKRMHQVGAYKIRRLR